MKKILAALLVLILLAGCVQVSNPCCNQCPVTTVVEKEVVVEKGIDKVVVEKEIIVVEKEVVKEVIVEKEVIKEVIVEKAVEQPPTIIVDKSKVHIHNNGNVHINANGNVKNNKK